LRVVRVKSQIVGRWWTINKRNMYKTLLSETPLPVGRRVLEPTKPDKTNKGVDIDSSGVIWDSKVLRQQKLVGSTWLLVFLAVKE
jgi:hypothetical protein